MGAVDGDSGGEGGGDGGADDAVFFVAEEAAFAGVGVEGADANAGAGGGEVLF